jgi:hypothetical protein
VKDDMSQLMQRFDRLESKIDDMIRRAAEKWQLFFYWYCILAEYNKKAVWCLQI